MSITVSEAMQLNHLKPLTLVSGQKGLSKKIDKIGILDHEIIEGVIGAFMAGDFVLTTFTAIRDDINKIEQCIKDLIACDVSALAIKKIYLKELPGNILEYANQNHFPIFMFDDTVYFEDIIEDLMEGMKSRSHMELMASKIEILFKNDLKKQTIKELAYELNRNFYPEHVVLYCKEKRYINDEGLINIAERYQRSRSKSIHHSVFKYNEGLMLILSYKKIKNMDVLLDKKHIFSALNITEDTFFIGESSWAYDLTSLDQSIKESIYAAKACELLKEGEKKYSDIGIYKLLLPYAEGKWLNSFTKEILDPIKNYDDGKLIETARVYIFSGGDIKKTAEIMFQHKNTIRYRVSKMQSLLNNTSEGEFYEQLSIAIKCEKLI